MNYAFHKIKSYQYKCYNISRFCCIALFVQFYFSYPCKCIYFCFKVYSYLYRTVRCQIEFCTALSIHRDFEILDQAYCLRNRCLNFARHQRKNKNNVFELCFVKPADNFNTFLKHNCTARDISDNNGKHKKITPGMQDVTAFYLRDRLQTTRRYRRSQNEKLAVLR